MSLRAQLLSMESITENGEAPNSIEIKPQTTEGDHDKEDAVDQVVEVSAENEDPIINEVQNDAESLTKMRVLVEEVGEQGISQESYLFASLHLTSILRKHDIKVAIPSVESFSGLSGDRRFATGEFVKQLRYAEEKFAEKLKSFK